MFLKVEPGTLLNALFFNDLENAIARTERGTLHRSWTVIGLTTMTLP